METSIPFSYLLLSTAMIFMNNVKMCSSSPISAYTNPEYGGYILVPRRFLGTEFGKDSRNMRTILENMEQVTFQIFMYDKSFM